MFCCHRLLTQFSKSQTNGTNVNGLFLQWGNRTITAQTGSNATSTINFGVSFYSTVYNVVLGGKSMNTNDQICYTATNKNSLTLRLNNASTTGAHTIRIDFIALGT